MALEDVFPEDPFRPSLSYAAYQNAPILLPWSKRLIALGAGFKSSGGDGGSRFCEDIAFQQSSLSTTPSEYRTDHTYKYVEASTTSAGTSYDHVDLSIEASVGGALLGASGQGTYESKALATTDAIKNSVRSDLGVGWISLSTPPRLSTDAISLLSTADEVDAEKSFNEHFGDYFVSGIRIGAKNANLATGAASSSADSKDVHAKLTAKALFFEKNFDYDDHESSSSFAGSISFVGFDSLDDWSATEQGSRQETYEQIKGLTAQNMERGKLVQSRIRSVLHRIGIKADGTVSLEQCQRCFEAGLVTDLLLLPFSGLRDFVAAKAWR